MSDPRSRRAPFRQAIAAGEDWGRRVEALIADAEKFVFLLSPDSAASPLSAREVDRAHRFGKQIVPVLARELETSQIPNSIAALNSIYMRDEADYEHGMQSLISVLSTDIDWIREHTRYLQRAMEWDAGLRPENRLLSGPDIAAAKAWAAHHPRNAPAPTELQLDFIKTIEAETLRQQSAEAQRLNERERLIYETEKAQAREAEQARRVVRRTFVGFAAAVILAVSATGFAIYASGERNRAEMQMEAAARATQEANKQKSIAEAAAERAQTLEAAIRRVDPGNPVLKEP